jgi:ArsR family transcriptional regulator, arsenate/arsenite/antimonite-responsive transcriptional repressor
MKTTIKPVPVDFVFRALSDRTRLRILNLLRGGELCVCDLVDLLGVPQPTASRHLAYLRKAGLVQARKQGHWSYYRLRTARRPFFERLLACLAVCCQEYPQLAKDDEQLSLKGRAPCCD